MPASTLADLLDFETQFDAALAAVLAPFAAAPYSLQLCGHTTTAELATPRLEYDFALAEPAGPEGSILVHPTRLMQISYGGTLTFRHVHDHAHTTTAQAAAFRGALRALLAPAPAPAFTSTNLPWLKLDALGESAALRDRYKDEREKLLSVFTSTWSVLFTIRDDAWPAA